MPALFDQIAVRLHPDDNIAIAKRDIPAGAIVALDSDSQLRTVNDIAAGHKFAVTGITQGSAIRRYGYPIGYATAPIEAGEWVHTHNVLLGDVRKDYAYQVVARLTPRPSARTFLGFRRADGRAGTRNYIAVIATVNCAARTASAIAHAFGEEQLARFPNVDGVIALTHAGGCSFAPNGLTHVYLQRTLAGIARNPNIGAALFVGLGCEGNQIDAYCDCAEPGPDLTLPSGARGLVIQERGGMRRTIEAGVERVRELLPQVNACERVPQPLSELAIALQCGGSDSWSGVTANPLVGRAMDLIAEEGGTAVLSETPEIFGAEHLLTSRVTSAAAGEKLIERFKWWGDQAERFGFHVDNNPTPGNKRGGLTTIYEKSLGAVTKGGSTPLNAVYEYAEPVTARGLVFMDTPGNDVISVTGQLAGGCNLIVFTTGRGSVLGGSTAPCIKVASNSAMYSRLRDDMDYDAGQIVSGIAFEQATDELLNLIIATASGQRTKSEAFGTETAFEPWQVGSAV